MNFFYLVRCIIIFSVFSVGICQQALSQCAVLPPIIGLGSDKFPDKLCSPVTADVNYRITFSGATTIGPNYELVFNWGDGSAATVTPLVGGNTIYNVTQNHAFPANSNCEYQVIIFIRVGGVPCTNTRQEQIISTWRTDEFNGGDVKLISPLTGTTIHEVCEGENIDVIFEDQTDWNCNANFPANYPPNNPVQFPNEQYRWQQIIYNTVPIALDKIPNVTVNGVPVTAAGGSDLQLNYQDPRGVHYLPPLVVVNDGDRRDALQITAPGGFGAGFPKVGDEFQVTIRYWNICNPYDNDFTNGNTTPTNGDLINGDNPPVERTAIIRIIDAPDKPIVADQLICNGNLATTTLTVTNVQANLTYKWYATLADAQADANVIQTGTTFTPSASQAPVGINDFYVTATQTNNCVSDVEEVILTRRENISTAPPTLVLPQTNVCPNTTYIYSLPSDPATEPVGGQTQFVWSVIPAANATITGGQGTKQITLQTNGTLGAFTLRVVRQFVNAPTCPSNPRNTTITVRANPTASISPSPVEICEGETPTLNGNPSNPFGAIASHTWTGATSIIDDATIQTPTILSTATSVGSPFTLTYTVTNDIGCSSTPVNVSVTINDNPAIATVGIDQALCGTLTSLPMGGSNPLPGTGTWTFVSSIPTRPAPTISNASTPNATITITSGNEGAYTMRWTVKNGTCESSADIVVDLGSNPTDPAAGVDKAVCGESFILEANTPIIGSGNWTVVSGPGGCSGAGCPITIQQADNPASVVELNGPIYTYGAYILRWTISSGTCTPESDDVTITFNEPGTADVPVDFISCVDLTTLTPITLTGATVGGGATQGRWEVVSGTGTFTSNNGSPGGARPAANTSDAYRPTAADFATGSVQLRFVALDPDGIGPCSNVSSSTNLVITFDRKPADADAGADIAICEGEDANLSAVAVTNSGTGTWSPTPGVVNINDETTVVTGLTSTTTFTWTVNSAFGSFATPPIGSCAATTDQVVVTVNPLPDAVDPAPSDLCETTAGTLTATNVTLSVYDDDVIGAANPADRLVKWYANAFDQVNDINPITSVDIHNNDKLFIRVIDITTAPLNCGKLQEVNFTVNPKPVVVAKSFYFCEEAPAGTGRVDDIDLTLVSVGDDITTLPAVDRVITWHTTALDAESGINPIASPNDIDITTNTIYYARVENVNTSCFNVVQVNLVVKPLPSDPVITGKADPCKNGSELYRVAQIPGATYTWTYPASFQYLGGGGANDFYVLLSFPNALSDEISVKVTINGCESNVVKKTIQVSDDPQGYSIVPPNVDICENGIYQFTVSPNNTGSSTYNWQVIKQSDGLVGGGIVADGQTTGVVQIQFLSEDVFVKVSESNASGCTGPPTQIPVVVNKRPIMDNSTISICSGDITGIILSENASSPVPATTFDVQVPSVLPGIIPVSGPTQGVLSPAGIENDSYKNQTIAPVLSLLYRVKPISVVGCIGEEKSITLDIKAEPVMDVNLGKAVCSDNPIEVTLKSAIGFLPADKFVIESIVYNSANVTPLDPLPVTGTLTLYDPTIIYSHRWENVTSSDATVTYNVRPYNSTTGCYGNPAVPVVITIQRKPLVTPVTLAPICSGDVLNIPLTSANVSNATFIWTVFQVNGNITGATGSTTNVIADKLVNNSLALGSVVYEVRATNPSSSPLCSGPPEYITVTVRPSPDITTPLNEAACSDGYGGNTVVKDLTTYHTQVSTEAGVTYTWFTDESDFAGSQIPPAQITAYTLTDELPVFVRVLNPAATSGCFKDAKVTFDVRPTPQLSVDPVETTDPRFNITCNGLANGQIVVSAQYGTNHTFSKDGVTFVPTVLFSNLGAGNYTIYTKNVEGCQDSAPVSIVQPDPIVEGTPSVVDVSCFNDPTPDGEIHITATGGTSAGGGDPLVFSLLQDSNIPYDAATQSFVGLRATTYTVRIEDKNGCTKFVPNIVVKQPNDIAFTIDITSDYNGYDVSCAGQNDGEVSVDIATITGGNPGYTYVLDQDPMNLTGQTDGSFQGLSANILYTITVTDTKGCEKTSLPELLIDPIPLFAGVVGFDKDICENADPTAFQELSQPFGGIGNYIYRWEQSPDNVSYSPAAGANNNPTYDPPPLTDLTYYRRVVASGTCAEDITDVVKVVVHALPQATLTAPSEICENGFFTLDFKFTNGQSPYFFDYTDGTTTFSLVGGEDRPVPVLNYTATKTFTLTHLKDFYGCEPISYPLPVTVKMINMNTSFTIAPSTPQCSGGEYTFTWTVNPDVEYVWTWNDGSPDEVIPAIPGPASPVVMQVKHIFTSANVAGNTVIPVTLTARSTTVAACIKQSTGQNITIYPNIFINATGDRTQICSGEKVKFINSTVGGSVHRWFYRTQGGDPSEVREERIFSTAASQEYTFTNTTSATVVYEVVYQVNNGSCSAETIIPVTVYRDMLADFNATSITPYTGGKAFVDFLNTSLPANDAEFRYEWDFGTSSNPTTFGGYTPPQIEYTSIGDKDIRLVVTNTSAEAAGLACFKDKTIRIPILLPPLMAAFRYTPQAACFPADIKILENQATGDVFKWTLKDKGGNTLIVSNETLPTFQVASPGEYTIFLETTNSITGQTATVDNRNTPVQIMENPYAAFEVVPDTIVFVPDETGIQMRNNTLRANGYTWDFDDGETSIEFQPQHHYQLEGNYTILLVASYNFGVKDFDGDGVTDGELVCYDTATQVIIAKKGGRIKIPNAFTPDVNGPNGGFSDGLFNDVFRPIMEGVLEFQMQIFDRWGNLIFESKDKNQGWDGYDKNGRLLPAGVYVYKITMRLSDEQRTTQIGDVTLIR